MPEGPEVKRICEDLNYNYKNRILTNIYFIGGRYVKNELNKSLPKNYLKLISTLPLKIEEVICKGKLIIIKLIDTVNDFIDNNIISTNFRNNDLGTSKTSNGFYCFITLGMTGAFDLQYTKHSHIVFEFKEQDKLERSGLQIGKYLYYSDTRRFGTIHFSDDKKDFEKKINSLGGEFLNGFATNELGFGLMTYKEFSKNIKRNRTYLVKALMDQKSICSGIGNYSLSEILHDSGIKNVDIKCNELTDKEIDDLYVSCHIILNLSYKHCGATMKDYHRLDGSKGKFTKYFKVYEKGRYKLGKHGRSIYY